jgi:hypothetical protein
VIGYDHFASDSHYVSYNHSLIAYPEGVIEQLSHRIDGTPRVVSAFVVSDSDDESLTEGEKHLCSCVDLASGMGAPEVAVLDRVVGSFNVSPVVESLVAAISRWL